MINRLRNKLNKRSIILLFILSFLFMGIIFSPSLKEYNSQNSTLEHESLDKPLDNLETSVAQSDKIWFDSNWEFRFGVNVSANGAEQNDVPVELWVNFTEYFQDPELSFSGTFELNISHIRVIQYKSKTSYVEIPYQFEPYEDYNNRTNAIGDLIWIMNGTTSAGQIKEYFVYFNNASANSVPEPNYDQIRIWHEGFEDLQRNEIISTGGSSQDQEPDDFEIINSVATRGNKSLHIWGNCWKSIDIGQTISVDTNTYATAQMRFDDPAPEREISGLGFHTSADLSSPNTYKIRGTQNWGIDTYENVHYDSETFFWYTFDLSDSADGIQNTNFDTIVFAADDDRSDSDRPDLYWDDISIWNQEVHTIPDKPIIVTKADELEPQISDLTIVCTDIDGFKVPNAHVYISNDSMTYLNKDGFTDINGEAFFSNTSRNTFYNITVEYTTQTGLTNPISVNYTFKNYKTENTIHNREVVKLDLWTMFFNTTNRDGDALQNTYVKIDNGTNDLGKKYLDNNGLCNITWLNQTAYNYSIYYDYSKLTDESSYANTEQLIFNSSISRIDPISPKYEVYEENISSTNWDSWNVLASDKIEASKVFRPENGTLFSEFNVSVNEVNTNYLEEFVVDVLSNGKWYEDIHVYTNDKSYVNNHSFYFNFTNTLNTNLHPSALRLTIKKSDLTSPHGTFNITYIENTYKAIQTNVSTLSFNVTDQNGGSNYLENAIIEIYNNTGTSDPTYPSVANLTVQEDGSAKFIGLNNQTEEWGNYTLKIKFAGIERPFKEANGDFDTNFNVSFDTNLNFSFLVNLNLEDYNMTFSSLTTSPSDLQNNFYWGGTIDLDFTVYINEPNNLEDPATPDQITLQIVDTDFGKIGDSINLLPNETTTGHFTYELDTSAYPLTGGTSYNIRITAKKAGYQIPEPLIKGFSVKSIPTSISIHNTTSPGLSKLTDNVSVYYNELVYLTVNYKAASGPLTGATVTYDWQFESNPVNVKADGNYYSFVINTSKATNVGKFELEISAAKQNYSSVIDFGFDLIILRRPTSVNGLTKLQHISQRIWVKQAINYTFEYNDTLLDKRLGDLDEAFYHWYRLDEQGNQIGEISNDTSLYQTNESLYVLDFNTEDKEVGYYAIFITLLKNNYETRSVVIDLTIRKRVFNTSLSATNLQGSQVNVVQGNDVELKLVLEDPTNDGAPLTGANVILGIGNEEYEFNETEDGVYTYTFSTEQINTLLASQTLTGNITISKEDYETQTLPITIAVGMTEIFPGMPTFYFMMIVGSAIAVGGSLAGYRYYQLAKIPEFVKRARSMSKDIKGGKIIDKTLLYSSKKEFMVEKLSDRWEELGLSLANILGVETKESKMIKKKTPSEEIKTKKPKKEEINTKTPETEPESESNGGGAE